MNGIHSITSEDSIAPSLATALIRGEEPVF